nr:myb family transcription factor EFM-like [Ipomoea batatas]
MHQASTLEEVASKFVSIALAEISAIDDPSQKLLKLYSLLQALEEEAKKNGGVDESIQLFVPYKTMAAEEAAATLKADALPVLTLSLSPPLVPQLVVVYKSSYHSHS